MHELKLDGYRMQARVDRKEISRSACLARTRLTHRMKSVAAAVLELPWTRCWMAGWLF